jgi:hypothetical protein
MVDPAHICTSLVVPQMEWVQTRYLLVQTATASSSSADQAKETAPKGLSFKPLDPKFRVTLSQKGGWLAGSLLLG